MAYVRTRDVELAPSRSTPSALETVVRHVRPFGAVVLLELDLVKDGRAIEAQVPRVQFDSLGLAKGRQVYVTPRNLRVFAEPGEPGED